MYCPCELIADLLLRQLPRHQVLNAVRVLTFDRNMQRVNAVSIRSIHACMRREEEFDQLDVASGKRVVERGTAASMLTIVRVGTTRNETRGDLEARFSELNGLTVTSRDLVQPAIKVALGHAYADWRGLEEGAAGRRAVQGCAGGSGRGRAHTLSEEFLDNVTLEAADCPDERVFVVLGRWRG